MKTIRDIPLVTKNKSATSDIQAPFENSLLELIKQMQQNYRLLGCRF